MNYLGRIRSIIPDKQTLVLGFVGALAAVVVGAIPSCYQSVNAYDLTRGKSFCGSYEAIAGVRAYVDGDERVTCFDGRSKRLVTTIVKE